MAKSLANLGFRGLLLLVGGVATLAGAASCAYGPAPVYGMLTCQDDTDCSVSEGWYCDQSAKVCAHRDLDAGTPPDAGSTPDGGS